MFVFESMRVVPLYIYFLFSAFRVDMQCAVLHAISYVNCENAMTPLCTPSAGRQRDSETCVSSQEEVKAIPTLHFKGPDSDPDNDDEMCLICIDDYEKGELLRELPCKCVDQVASNPGVSND